MITKKTVLILGAGASMDYGFPSGKELIEDIVNLIDGDIISDNRKKKVYIAALLRKHLLDNKIKISKSDGVRWDLTGCYELVEKFYNTLINSSVSSIDDFINKASPIDQIIGKICIALAISMCEDEKDNFSTYKVKTLPEHRYYMKMHHVNPDTSRYLKLKEGWYKYLWKKIYECDEGKYVSDNLKNLTIITFNYDRSLEYFLYTRIINLLRKSPDKAGKILNENLVIYHVYGQIGYLQWQTGKAKNEYGSIRDTIGKVINALEECSKSIHPNSDDFWLNLSTLDNMFLPNPNMLLQLPTFAQKNLELILSICKEIKTYTETPDFMKKTLYNKLYEAERIFFLGFGYHKQNLELLNPDRKDLSTHIAGTTYSLGKAEVWNIKGLLLNTFRPINDSNSISLLRIDKNFDEEKHKDYKIQDYLENVLSIE